MQDRIAVESPNAPKPTVPYSQAIIANGMVFVSGTLPFDKDTGRMVEGGFEAQLHQVFRNVIAVLETAGTGLDRVVKTTVFMKDMNDFALMNTIYKSYFPDPLPARSTIEVARLPADALVEIEAIALV
jgi:2-iminobutanoate/2-iminopropanoate deaminase